MNCGRYMVLGPVALGRVGSSIVIGVVIIVAAIGGAAVYTNAGQITTARSSTFVSRTNSTTSFVGSNTTCGQSAASIIYLTVVNSSTEARIRGVNVSGNVKWLCGSITPPGYSVASESLGPLDTPSNGTINIGSSIIGNYSLILQYLDSSYQVNFSPGAEQIVNVTVALPSDKLTVVGCSFGGAECFNETNPNNETLVTNSTLSSNEASNQSVTASTLTTCSAGYSNGVCGPTFVTTTTLFDGASYCMASNCQTLYPPGVADPNIVSSSGGNLTLRFSTSNIQVEVVETQGCVSTAQSCIHNNLAILLPTILNCTGPSETSCTLTTDALNLPSVSATGNYVDITVNYGLQANVTLGSDSYYLAIQ
jgi:hypothetical protein